jgi:hypothetical protein
MRKNGNGASLGVLCRAGAGQCSSGEIMARDRRALVDSRYLSRQEAAAFWRCEW